LVFSGSTISFIFDFSQYVVYADKGAGFVPINTLSNITDTIVQIAGVDALNRSDCYKIATTNLCKFTQKEVTLNKHCTIELRGKAGVNASILNWSNYVGWLVDKYVVYRQIGTSNFDSIGQVDGSTLSYIDTSIKCYKVHHYKVKAYQNGGLNEFSWSDTCHVSPIYLNQVAPPEMKRATVLNDQYVRVEWQQLVKNKIPLERFVIVGKENKSSNKNIWIVNAKSDSLVVNDKSFSVDNTNAIYKVLGIDECGDSSKFSLVAQSILLDVSMTNQYFPFLQWNKYIEWPEGVKEYIVERNSGNGLLEIDRIPASDSTYIDPLPSLNCLPDLEYRITALRNKTVGADSSWFNNSCSNIDDPGVKTKVFIPNAFTPNGNNLNELFKPEGIFIANYTMKIFNRWGEKIYEGQGCGSGWDGIYRSEIVPGGVYVYIVNVKGTDGKWYPFSGDVTVLR
jgi:gliding motility-associated-like protein